MAQLELGCDSVTVLPASIADLLACHEIPSHTPGEWSRRWKTQVHQADLVWDKWPASSPDKAARLAALMKSDPLAGSGNKEFLLASTEVDYLAEGVLDELNENDETTKFRVADAIDTFKRGEDKLLDFIRSVQAEES